MNKFLYALRSIGITIVGVVIAVLVTSGLHQLFSLFLDPLPMEDLMAADWAGRSNIMESYMATNPFAIYSMLVAHSLGSALAVYWYVRATKVPSWRTEKGIKPYRSRCFARTLDMGRCTKRSLRRACRRVLDHCRCNHYCCSDCACLCNCWRIA